MLHQLFEIQASATPEAVATVCNGEVTCYAQLNVRANQIAHCLQSYGVGASDVVGICLSRSTDLVAAVIAVMKSGAAYVPLDPDYPSARLAFMTSDAQARVVITSSEASRGLPATVNRIVLDEQVVDIEGRPTTNLPCVGTVDDLAYIIYTSGSTGKPKGVVVRHRSVLNLVEWVNSEFQVCPTDRLLFVASICFDLSVYDIFGMLAVGASIHIATRDELRSPSRLVRSLLEDGITFWDSAPAALSQLAPLFPAAAEHSQLRLVFLSGDWVPLVLPGQIRSAFPKAEVVALGGATEATVWSNYFRVDVIDPSWKSIPYGRPIKNARYYILDAELAPVAAGDAGDLYIGGLCVADGYHNRPDLNAKSFLPDPFRPDEGTALYRTGDRARYLADGNIEFLGRLDDQVKIRGYRIELAEIEAALNQINGIQQAVVTAPADHTGDRILVGYFVPESSAATRLNQESIASALSRSLPSYMVPAHYVELATFPLTANGKVDRRGLPEPRMESKARYVAPRNETEQALAGIWAEVLDVERVGVDAHFFDLGGNSLLAARMVARACRHFDCDLDLSETITAPTIAMLASRLRPGNRSDTGPVRGLRGDPVPMSSPQERIFYLWSLGTESSLYNVCSALDIEGSVDATYLRMALDQLVRRHEILRTTFDIKASGGVQEVHAQGSIPLVVDDCPIEQFESVTKREAERAFDLRSGPCIRARLMRAGPTRTRLVITQHHLLTDDWSLSLLLSELAALYRRAAGENADLPPVEIQFAEYSEWQRARSADADIAFFAEELRAAPQPLALPYDKPRPASPSRRGLVSCFELAAPLVESLEQHARDQTVTPFVVFLAAFDILLHRLTGADDILVGTPVATRTWAQVENTIGFFANTLVLRTRLDGNPTFKELVQRANGAVQRAWSRQEAPFERVAQLLPKSGTVDVPQVMLILRNDEPQVLEVGDARWQERVVFTDTAKFDLTFVLVPADSGAKLYVEFDTDLFERETIERFAAGFETVLATAIAQPTLTIADLSVPTGTNSTAEACKPRIDSREATPPGKPSATPTQSERHIAPTAPPAGDGASEEHREPIGVTEQALAEIWEALLGVSSIGANVSFFALGGHSLMALRMVGHIEERFGVAPALRTVLQQPTIAAIAKLLTEPLPAPKPVVAPIHGTESQAAPASNNVGPGHDSVPFNLGGFHPLSFSQEQVWTIEQLVPGNGAYHISIPLRITGLLDSAAVQAAINSLAERHEALRTVFVDVNGAPRQLVKPSAKVQVEIVDSNSNTNRFLASFIQRPFDLANGPPIRLMHCRIAQDDHVLCFVVHHITADGWSVDILKREFFQLYSCCVNAEPPALEALSLQQTDWAAQQGTAEDAAGLEESIEYWKDRLAGVAVVFPLPLDRPRPIAPNYRGGRVTLVLDAPKSAAVLAAFRESGVSLYVGGLAAFKVLLARVGQDDDVVVGSPFTMREGLVAQKMIADCINTVVLRTSLAGNPTGSELLARVNQTTNSALAHSRLPFQRLVKELQPHRARDHNPVFQVLFGVDLPVERIEATGIEVAEYFVDPGRSQLDLSLYLRETPTGLQGDLYFNSDIFDRDTAARLVDYYVRILDALVDDLNLPIGDIGLVNERDEQKMLVEWNGTQADYPDRLGIHELFESRVAQTPAKIAVAKPACDDQPGEQLSYAELNSRANQLAHLLRQRGVDAGNLVALAIHRGPSMLVGLLGILKAGAAYLPLDPTYPQDRIEWMIVDSGVQILVTDRPSELPKTGLNVVCLEADKTTLNSMPVDDLDLDIDSTALAYVIYTSGSSGRPKGVAIQHRSVVNFLSSMAAQPGLTAADRLLAVTTLSFDIAVLELFLPLVTGGMTLIASRQDAADGARLAELLASENITVMQATPSTWRLILESGWPGSKDLKVLCGGEPLPPELARSLLPKSGSLWNMYGPTETTIWSTTRQITDASERITVGRPIANTTVFILDQRLRPAPVGVTGELYIGGDGLAQGYLGRPDLTAERFIASPFGNDRSRLYRTGDLARFQPDGQIVCLGRIDSQVKLRGFRIELGEVENTLEQIDGVDQALVELREDGPTQADKEPFLAAYVRGPQPIPTSMLRHCLGRHLPVHMMPRTYTWLEEFPLLPNGKVDRSRLPIADSLTEAGQLPTATALEQSILQIWANALGTMPTSVHEDFFELGGSSLLALQVASQVQTETGHVLLPSAFLARPTIAGIASSLLQRAPVGNRRSNLTLLSSGGSNPPLVMFPGIGGHPFTFRELAQRMDDRPVIGAHLIGVEGDVPPMDRIEDMAERYVDDIEEIHPHGPIALGGYSVGAYIAYEVAELLLKRGRVIDSLVLVDAEAPGYAPYSRIQQAMLDFKRDFIDLPWKSRLLYVKQRLRRLTRGAARKPIADRQPPSQILSEFMRRAFDTYRPQPTSLGALLLRIPAVDTPPHLDDVALGWGKLIHGGVDVKLIPGEHLTIFDRENIDALMDCLVHYLARKSTSPS